MSREVTPPQQLWWLEDEAGGRRLVDAGGLLLGRSPGCDIVLRVPRASRSHALLYRANDGPRLVRLGRGRTDVNGSEVDREQALRDGDRVEVPGARLRVTATAAPVDDAASAWVLQNPAGVFFGVSSTPFSVGGETTDDLHLRGWPARALTLHAHGAGLQCEAHVALEIDGRPVAAQSSHRLQPGCVVTVAGQSLRLVTGGALGSGSTVVTGGGDAPDGHVRRVEFQFLPRGGRLTLDLGDETRAVYLPGRRSDLMALLLSPPEPHRPGDILDDEFLIERLWPRAARTRFDLNTLVYRLRKDLMRADIDASSLIRRAPGGGGTHLDLPPSIPIELRAE